MVDVEITFWTHVGWDGVLVMLFSLGIAGLFVYIVYFVYQEISSMASARGVGIYGVCGVVRSTGGKVFMDVEKNGDGLYGTTTGGEQRKSRWAKTVKVCYRTCEKAAGNAKMCTKNFKSMDNGFCGSCMFLNCLSRRNSVSTWSPCICALCRCEVGPLLYVFC